MWIVLLLFQFSQSSAAETPWKTLGVGGCVEADKRDDNIGTARWIPVSILILPLLVIVFIFSSVYLGWRVKFLNSEKMGTPRQSPASDSPGHKTPGWRTQACNTSDHNNFLKACEDGNTDEVMQLLESDANLLKLLDADQNSPLHLAVKKQEHGNYQTLADKGS